MKNQNEDKGFCYKCGSDRLHRDGLSNHKDKNNNKRKKDTYILSLSLSLSLFHAHIYVHDDELQYTNRRSTDTVWRCTGEPSDAPAAAPAPAATSAPV